MQPPHRYLRESCAAVVHHADYLGTRDDHALCGVTFVNLTALTETAPTDGVCPDCEARLVLYHVEWWREAALAATAEVEELRAKYEVGAAPAQVDPVIVEQPAVDHTEPATFLDRARRELTELCRQFDSAVPYYKLNNAMQAFSDTLDDSERLVLAQEIGSDSSLIRWATTEVETRGFSVTNNRVQQENSDMMWEEWLQESTQAPPKTKKRFGRSR